MGRTPASLYFTTKTIRIGSGGIMLPNHSPLVIAEQFGTVASLYPDRIDLGPGRAPGTDMAFNETVQNLASVDSVNRVLFDRQGNEITANWGCSNKGT